MERLPVPAVFVLLGASGSGKSTWAEATFDGRSVVSSDRLRALTGEGPQDQAASTDAFSLLEQAVDARLRRRLTTIIDTVGHDPERRRRWVTAARTAGLPAIAVYFDVSAAACKARNRTRDRRVPERVIDAQARALREQRPGLDDEGFDAVVVIDDDTRPSTTVPAAVAAASAAAHRQEAAPTDLAFGLHVSTFDLRGGADELGERLAEIAVAAEKSGFSSIRVMDHPMQIPQVGRAWDPILEPFTTLAHVAAHTDRVTVGPLVAGVTYRNVGLLGKTVASLDVLSGGRAECGIGAAWYERDHLAYGYRFPSLDERYALLEDALQLLPALWGPGTKPFEGRVLRAAETVCYPRPLRGTVPILVGGQGERRTLRLVARHADACNLQGTPDVVSAKLTVLAEHCAVEQRDPADVRVTHLSNALVGDDHAHVEELVDRHAPPRGRDRWRSQVHAGTAADQVGRYRQLADAGVQEAIVSLTGLTDAADVERFAPVIDAFR